MPGESAARGFVTSHDEQLRVVGYERGRNRPRYCAGGDRYLEARPGLEVNRNLDRRIP
jgi:hypothetical protein